MIHVFRYFRLYPLMIAATTGFRDLHSIATARDSSFKQEYSVRREHESSNVDKN